jgi:hypothetical protein
MESEKQEKSKKALGIVFLACGVTFMSVGLATKILALWGMAPGFIALGVVFLAMSGKKRD